MLCEATPPQRTAEASVKYNSLKYRIAEADVSCVYQEGVTVGAGGAPCVALIPALSFPPPWGSVICVTADPLCSLPVCPRL